MSYHLLLPLGSSVLVVFGLLTLQRAQHHGASTWMSMISLCCACAVVSPALTFLGGSMQPATLLWQPAIIGALFLAGQLFTLLAVERGDVSIAAPVMGAKVLFVPAFSPFFIDDELSAQIWISAAIAMVGIACVQSRDAAIQRSRVLAAVGFALLAASCMTLFDLLIQSWAPAWGAGYFLPIAFGFSALFSLAFLGRAIQATQWKPRETVRPLAAGAVLMAIQAKGMTVTLGLFGDAARVNIVYSLRGLWGVVLTWALIRHTGETTSTPSHRTMTMRLVGAVLIGVSVVISVT